MVTAVLVIQLQAHGASAGPICRPARSICGPPELAAFAAVAKFIREAGIVSTCAFSSCSLFALPYAFKATLDAANLHILIGQHPFAAPVTTACVAACWFWLCSCVIYRSSREESQKARYEYDWGHECRRQRSPNTLSPCGRAREWSKTVERLRLTTAEAALKPSISTSPEWF